MRQKRSLTPGVYNCYKVPAPDTIFCSREWIRGDESENRTATGREWVVPGKTWQWCGFGWKKSSEEKWKHLKNIKEVEFMIYNVWLYIGIDIEKTINNDSLFFDWVVVGGILGLGSIEHRRNHLFSLGSRSLERPMKHK